MEASADIGVCYLARGADEGAAQAMARFLESYRRFPAGVGHRLYVIFKGFADRESLAAARRMFDDVAHTPMHVGDDNFDIGAYVEWANRITEPVICPLNTKSQILGADWLLKLQANFNLPGVGLVGATGSYESQMETDAVNYPPFPNVHIRSNAFMVDRQAFCRFTRELVVKDKTDAHRFESSRVSLTRHIIEGGAKVLLVGRNGRGYAPKFWPISETFRQGRQDNLLIADNQTRAFAALPWAQKREAVLRTWGDRDADHPLSGRSSTS